MKTITSIVLLSAALFCASAMAQNTPSEYALFKKEHDRIEAQREAKLISRTAMFQEKLAAAKTYMPNDRISQAYYMSLIGYSEQLDKKQITQEEYKALAAARGERFMATIKDLNDAADRAEQAQQRQGPQTVYVENNNPIPAAMFLNKVGQAFSSSYNQYLIPMTTCNSWGQGMVTCY